MYESDFAITGNTGEVRFSVDLVIEDIKNVPLGELHGVLWAELLKAIPPEHLPHNRQES